MVRPQILVTALLVLLGLGFAKTISAQSSTHFVPGPGTHGLSPVLLLEKGWTDVDHKPLDVPFHREDVDEMSVQCLFSLNAYDSLPDSLYLYAEGIAWTSEVYLNNKLVGITDDPFREHIFLLDKRLFVAGGNLMEIRMRAEGVSKPFYPLHFLGVFRQVAILMADGAADVPMPLKKAQNPTKAVMIAPWASGSGFAHDSLAVSSVLKGLYTIPPGIPITFAFRPSNASIALVAKSKYQVVEDWKSVDSLAFYNSYPVSHNPKPLTMPFWREGNMRPTNHYGIFVGRDQVMAPVVMPLDKLALMIFVFLPILLLLTLKMALPRVFDNLPEYLTRSKIYMELIASNKFLKDQQRLLMTFIRTTLLALTVSMFLYYLSVAGTWDRLNFLSDSSLLFQAFSSGKSSLYVLFLDCWLFVVGLTIAKYLLLNFIAGVYRIHGFAGTIQSLDIFASFPMNLMPLLPASVIFFLPADQGGWVLGVWYSTMCVYWLRRLFVIGNGLSRLFSLPLGLKILYICTLEISPWLFLL